MTPSKKIVIIAGPSWAGKTTFAREFLPNEAHCPNFINADLIAADPRALQAWPKIDLMDERDANQFGAVLWRPRNEQVTQPVTGEVTGEATGEVRRLLMATADEMKRSEIQRALGLKHEDHFRNAYLQPALAAKLIEMTLPDKPRSSKQRYRLTMRGQAELAQP